jgi:KUP system potassium uptake protein
MAITSIVFYVVTREHWGWSKLKAAAVLVLFLSFDIPFLVANALKFFAGGYLPFLVGVGFVLVMVSWRIGRSFLGEKMKNLSSPLDAFIAELPSRLIGRVPGVGVVLASQQGGAPPVLNLLVRRFKVLHEHLVLVTIVTDHVPEVDDAHRHHIEKVTDDIFRVVLHYGYMQTPNVPEALIPALRDLGLDAKPEQLTYFLGRETLIHGPEGHMSGVLEAMFLTLSRNVRSATDYFSLPPSQVVELGIQLDL